MRPPLPATALPALADAGPTYSLRNPEVQAKFRAHIASKLVKFHSTFPDSTPDGRRIPSSAKRQEELSIILLDFRMSARLFED